MTHVVQLIFNFILKILKIFHNESINKEMKQKNTSNEICF